MLEEYSLNGRVALVTGAGNRFGRVSALALAEAGASVAVVSRDGQGSDETATAIVGTGGTAISVRADVTDPVQVQSAVDHAVAAFGKIDILVNGEDAEFGKPLLSVSLEEWRRVIDLNATSVFLCCKAVAPLMIQQGKGKIINLTSGLGVRAAVGTAAYGAAKGAVSQLTQALSLEWGPNQISINVVAPGWFASGPVNPEEELRQPLVRMIPQRRRGQPEEVSALVIYLASDAADFITGQTLVVDGGSQVHG